MLYENMSVSTVVGLELEFSGILYIIIFIDISEKVLLMM